MGSATESRARAPLIGLMGNPNTGKSTVFNRLTGMRQRVANYPGITTEAKGGHCSIGGRRLALLDLPGTYSLSASSPDERVVIDVLLGHRGLRRPDLLVCVLDASNLKRNLFLASQLAEFEIPIILVLNQWDVAKRQGQAIRIEELEAQFGVPVIATVGTKGEGIERLRQAILAMLDEPRRMARIGWRGPVREAVRLVVGGVRPFGDELTEAEAQRLVFDANSALKGRLKAPAEVLREVIDKARATIRASGLNPTAAEAILHYEHTGAILERAVDGGARRGARGSESIDGLLLHRFWGSIVFVAVMWVVFQSVYAWAGPLMRLIDSLTGVVQDAVAPLLGGTPMLRSLVVDGIIGGVGGVIVFLPQIMILFLFIAVLEDSGYMARAAFVMDKLFGWCGLNGKSFVPLLSSYACAIPGILAARTLEQSKARITTMMMAPLMSCSARLPVYVLLIGTFVEPAHGPVVAGWTLFAMHIVGLVVALPVAWLANRVLTKTAPMPFILEIPDYKIPDGRNLLLRMWEGGREFLVRAGTVILAFSVIIWALLYFPRDPAVGEAATREFVAAQAAGAGRTEAAVAAELAVGGTGLAAALSRRVESAYIEQSLMGRFGKAVQPLFAPAGFDWKITVGVLASFPAREVIISTLGIIYDLGSGVDEESDDLRSQMVAARWGSGPAAGRPVFTLPVAVAIMVFFALCGQCGATVAVLSRQLNWGWGLLSFGGMSVLAWLGAVAVYQAGVLLGW